MARWRLLAYAVVTSMAPGRASARSASAEEVEVSMLADLAMRCWTVTAPPLDDKVACSAVSLRAEM